MVKNTTVRGRIASLLPWKSGKGYFLNLENDQNDYFGHGTSKREVGEEVTMQVKPGEKGWEHKTQIVSCKKQVQEKIKEEAKQTEPSATDAGEIPDGLTVYMDKQRAIIEQSCLKAAANLVGELFPRQEAFNKEIMVDLVLWIKDKFVFDIVTQGKEKELAEEP